MDKSDSNEVYTWRVYDNDTLEIAGIISEQNETVMTEMKKCLSDPKGYFNAHGDIFGEWFMNDRSDDQEICKVALIHLLEQGNFVCNRDWKDEKEDFIYFVSNLENFKRLGLSIEEELLDETDDISVWADILNDQWKDRDCCLANIDIGSDSYVLFTCETYKLKRLEDLFGPDRSRVTKCT